MEERLARSSQELVFSWLGWSPSGRCQATLQEHFPGALPSRAVLYRSCMALGPLGLDRKNSIFGTSICPDAKNCRRGSLPDLMQEHWGKSFPLGGVGGMPLVGRTGFEAFRGLPHGNIVLLFGPHIAISEEGELRWHLPSGYSEHASSCAALLAAYDSCCRGTKPGSLENPGFREPVGALLAHTFDVICAELKSITDHGDGYLVLLGGVQINMPQGMEDHFLPMLFEAGTRGEPVRDLMSAFKFDVGVGT